MSAQKRWAETARIIGLSLLLLVMVFPIIWTIMNAFKSTYDIVNNPFALPTSLDFSNIIGAWEFARFDIYIFNTIFVTVVTVLLTLIVACPAGYAFAHLRFKGDNILFYCLFIGLSIPSQAMIISVFYRMKQFGLINSLWGVIMVLVGLGMPFNIFLMRNAYRDLSRELRESACIDGAGEWRIFLQIFLPLGQAAMMALVVFAFIGTWNEYMYPLVLLISPDKQVIATAIAAFKNAQTANYGYIFGAAFISLVPSVAVYLLFQKSFIQGVTAGATKG